MRGCGFLFFSDHIDSASFSSLIGRKLLQEAQFAQGNEETSKIGRMLSVIYTKGRITEVVFIFVFLKHDTLISS